MTTRRRLASSLIGNRWVSAAFGSATRGRLRVIAYHEVPEPERFARQMSWISEHFTPVGLTAVRAAARGQERLPRGAVWITFDDGRPSVVDHAQGVLEGLGISATLFVCPGLVDTHAPYWWEVIDQALASGLAPVVDGRPWRDGSLVAHLKTRPDADRRAVVQQVTRDLERATGALPTTRQLTTEELRGWLAAGHDVGNHTWDHPCLGTCDPRAQREQVERAHAWLRDLVPDAACSFAYPNGDWTPETESALRDLGYEVGAVFDHRLAGPNVDWLRVSRLRLSSDDPLSRCRAVMSGGHSALLNLVGAR